MLYLSGPLSFCVPCELDTPGEWRVSPAMWKDENVNKSIRNSEDSPFKDYGINQNVYIQWRPLCLYNVANHVRVYLDMLYEQRFEELEGMFFEYIDSGKYRKDIFDQVFYRCKHLAEFKEINEFMTKEFGNAWLSYIDAIHKSAEHISHNMSKFKQESCPEDSIPDFSTLINNTKNSYDLSNVNLSSIIERKGSMNILKEGTL